MRQRRPVQRVGVRIGRRHGKHHICHRGQTRWTIPGPRRPLFEDATANFSRHSPAKVDTHLADRGPPLLISGSDDHTVLLKVTKGF